MATQLSLVDPDRDYDDPAYYHPVWRNVANGGHKQFAKQLYAADVIQTIVRNTSESDWVHRPDDCAAWRAAILAAGLPNLELFLQMIDILEAEPNYWLNIGW